MTFLSRIAIVVLASWGFAGAPSAAPCYVIYDQKDVIVYSDVVPPFDLSVKDSPERATLRKRGAHLLVAEFDTCQVIGYISPTTGASTATVDEIVMRLKPAINTSISTAGSYVGSGTAPK